MNTGMGRVASQAGWKRVRRCYGWLVGCRRLELTQIFLWNILVISKGSVGYNGRPNGRKIRTVTKNITSRKTVDKGRQIKTRSVCQTAFEQKEGSFESSREGCVGRVPGRRGTSLNQKQLLQSCVWTMRK